MEKNSTPLLNVLGLTWAGVVAISIIIAISYMIHRIVGTTVQIVAIICLVVVAGAALVQKSNVDAQYLNKCLGVDVANTKTLLIVGLFVWPVGVFAVWPLYLAAAVQYLFGKCDDSE